MVKHRNLNIPIKHKFRNNVEEQDFRDTEGIKIF